MTIRVASGAGVSALLALLLGQAGPASAQGRGDGRSRVAVETCLERAGDVLHDSDGGRGVDVEVDEVTGVDGRGGDRVRVRGRLRVVDDDGRRGTARLDCEVDLGGVGRVVRLDEDGLLRDLDRRRERDRDRDRRRPRG